MELRTITVHFERILIIRPKYGYFKVKGFLGPPPPKKKKRESLPAAAFTI